MNRIVIIIGLLIMISSAAWAHPPNDLFLDYDKEAQVLKVRMRHTTHDPREDYIRKLVIQLGKKAPVVKRYTIQTNTMEFSDDVGLTAEPGDTVTVKAYSSEGGSRSASLTVPKTKDSQKEGAAKKEPSEPKQNIPRGSAK